MSEKPPISSQGEVRLTGERKDRKKKKQAQAGLQWQRIGVWNPMMNNEIILHSEDWFEKAKGRHTLPRIRQKSLGVILQQVKE